MIINKSKWGFIQKDPPPRFELGFWTFVSPALSN